MSEQDTQQKQEKKYTTEWSFSFDKLGESINRMLGSIGVGDQEVKTAQYAEPVDGALSAHIKLGAIVGQVIVSALEDSDNLFEADLTYIGDLRYEVSGDAEKTIKLGQKMPSGSVGGQMKKVLSQFTNRDDAVWRIGINPNVPVKLELDAGVGVSRLDLTGLRVTDVDLDVGVGESFLTLPATGSRYSAKVEGGVGAAHIVVADGAALNLKIEGGVGSVDLHLPEDAAVRIEAESGLGGVTVPAHLNRVRGGSEFIGSSGVWETTGFNIADKQIFVRFDGGIGSLKVV